MSLARRAARAALAASFVSGGLDQIRNPQPKAGPASPVAKPITDRVPQLPNDPESLVKLDGAIKVVGGLGLIFGPFARPAALLLAGSMVPTTLSGHRFWETTDPDQKVSDRVEFFKNVSLLGGLLIAALDTGGRPSVPYVAGKAVKGVSKGVGEAAETVGETVSGAAGALAGAAGAVATTAGKVSRRAAKKSAKQQAKAAKLADAAKAAAAVKAAKAARDAKKAAKRSKADAAARTAAARAAEARGRAQARAAELRTKLDARARERSAAEQSAQAAGEARGAAAHAAEAAKSLAGATKGGALAAKDKVSAAVSR